MRRTLGLQFGNSSRCGPVHECQGADNNGMVQFISALSKGWRCLGEAVTYIALLESRRLSWMSCPQSTRAHVQICLGCRGRDGVQRRLSSLQHAINHQHCFPCRE